MFDTAVTSLLRTLTIFALVFYTGQVLGRCNQRYGDLWSTLGTLINFCGLCAADMPESEAIAATRYCYAFYAMHYLMIDLEMGQKDWEFLISMDILTPEEVAFLLAQPSPNLTCYMWALKSIGRCAKSSPPTIDSQTKVSLCDHLGKIRGVSAKQILWQLTPIPFHYFHMMTVLTCSYLFTLVWNQGLAFDNQLELYGVPYAIVNLAGTGLIINTISALWFVAVMLSDPVGDDTCDYDLGFDIKFGYNTRKALLHAAFPVSKQKRTRNSSDAASIIQLGWKSHWRQKLKLGNEKNLYEKMRYTETSASNLGTKSGKTYEVAPFDAIDDVDV